jgi:hypothetical protein
MTDNASLLLALCAMGVVVGLVALWRGFAGYRAATLVGDTASSRIATLAAGEVRVSGTIQPAELTLVSPIQSTACVWYRARVRTTGRNARTVLDEERGTGFRLRDASGTIRVFPAGARIDAPLRFKGRTGLLGEAPIGLNLRAGSTFGPGEDATGQSTIDRDAAIAALLTVQPRTEPDPALEPGGSFGGLGLDTGASGRDYEEARLEVGDVVTLVGTAMPFGQLPDPSGADRFERSGDPSTGLDDPVVEAELDEARGNGRLLDPQAAWGNAAIPGFGIGKPVRAPVLDPDATPEPVAPAADVARNERIFDLAPDTLVIAASPGSSLLIATGGPGEVVARDRGRFLLGLLGALLAIASAGGGALLLAR